LKEAQAASQEAVPSVDPELLATVEKLKIANAELSTSLAEARTRQSAGKKKALNNETKAAAEVCYSSLWQSHYRYYVKMT
jgi:hypothetical protein